MVKFQLVLLDDEVSHGTLLCCINYDQQLGNNDTRPVSEKAEVLVLLDDEVSQDTLLCCINYDQQLGNNDTRPVSEKAEAVRFTLAHN
ncbi:hypothetical protein J6590_057769 [Homalodisca vitripennis]|nr:hypothetical protein J6590_057769 [Homalodisca vitripennis]